MGFPSNRQQNDRFGRRVLCVPVIDRQGGRFPLLRQIGRRSYEHAVGGGGE